MYKITCFVFILMSSNIEAQNAPIIDSTDYNLICYYKESRKVSAFGNVSGIVQHGKWILFHENGNIKAVGSYRKGQRKGKWRFFDEDGELLEFGRYQKGLKVGTWVIYEKFTAEYKKGILIKQNAYQ